MDHLPPPSTSLEEQVTFRRTALEDARLNGDSSRIAWALVNLAQVLILSGREPEGRAHFAEAGSIARDRDDAALQRRFRLFEAAALAEIGRLEEVFYACSSLLDEVEAVGDLTLKSDVLGQLAEVLLETGDPGTAILRLRDGLEIARQLGDDSRIMAHLGALGTCYLQIADTEFAANFFEHALELAKQTGNLQAQAGYLNNLGLARLRGGDNRRNAALFEQARDLNRRLGNDVGERNALRFLHTIYAELGRVDLQIECLRRAIEISFRLRDPDGLSDYRQQYIDVLLAQHREAEAVGEIQAAIETSDHDGRSDRRLELFSTLGDVLYRLDRLEDAGTAYRSGLELATRLQDWQAEAELYGRLGAVSADLGDPAGAVRLAERSIERARRINNIRIEGEQLGLLAMAYLDLRQNEQAEQHCREAITIFHRAGLETQLRHAEELLNQIIGGQLRGTGPEEPGHDPGNGSRFNIDC